ncbi:protein phosphatase [Reinekea sp.]|jgi:protein-tyrosine phosphatase|uniref:phosphatase domain-containing protein n=1 Tax=Reinekea sp. TaxID=1970455 RepID=UPI0039890956
MAHPFDLAPMPGPSDFIFMPCPGTKGEPLSDSLAQIKAAGAVGVVSMLSDEELEFLQVPSFGEACKALNLSWYQLPVEDDCAPETAFFEAFDHHKKALMAHMDAGETLAIHCRGGTGRTGLMAAILLLERNQTWPDVKASIQSVRPKALTLTPHVEYLKTHYKL